MHVIALALLLTATIQGLATPLRDQVKSLVNKRLSKSLVDRYLSKSLTLADKINQVDDYGCNALHYAAEFGDLSLVKFLMKKPRPITTAICWVKNKHTTSPILIATLLYSNKI